MHDHDAMRMLIRQRGDRHHEPALLRRRVAGISSIEKLFALPRNTERVRPPPPGELRRCRCPGAVTKIEVIDAGSMSRTLNRCRAGSLPPRLIHREDQAVGIEQGELRGQRVVDGCFPATQVILSGPYSRKVRPSAHRIDLACGQFFQALRALVWLSINAETSSLTSPESR